MHMYVYAGIPTRLQTATLWRILKNHLRKHYDMYDDPSHGPRLTDIKACVYFNMEEAELDSNWEHWFTGKSFSEGDG